MVNIKFAYSYTVISRFSATQAYARKLNSPSVALHRGITLIKVKDEWTGVSYWCEKITYSTVTRSAD